MTDLLHDIDAPSDAELISRVRGGDVAAYGELFGRHVDAARRLARQLVRGPDADDLVSDAFAKVLGVLQGGGGPDVAFRAYLLTAVRRLHIDKIRAGSKLQSSDDMEVFDAGVPFQDTAVAAFESGAAAKAFASLPERWQLVLWHLEVEGQKPADIAPLLGMSANSVSALAYRAREGLRQAFLTMHLNDTSDTSCRWVNEHLGAYVRNGLAKRDAAKVQTHLDECRRCTAMYLELTEVNSNLRGIIAPLLLGAAAAGYLSSTGAAGGGFGLVAFLGRARDAVTANAGAATAGAVAAGVAAVATAGIMLLPSSTPEDTVTGADGPIGQATTPGVPGGEDSPSGDRDGREGSADDGEVAGGEEPADGGTAVSEEPALDPTPESVPISDAGTEPTGNGGAGSQEGSSGSDAGGDTDPNQPPAEEPPGEEPPGEEPPGEEPPGEEPPAPPGEEPPAPPGEEPPGEEPPGEEPPAGPVSLNVTVGGSATLGENSVAFEVSAGTENLPPTVAIDIESDPEGITFGSSSACTPASDGKSVVCSTGSPATGLLSASFLRVLVSTEGVPTIVTAPLSVPGDQPDTRLRFTLAVPTGYTDPEPGDNVATATYSAPVTPPASADVSLSLPSSVPATATLDYQVDAVVGGVPESYEGPLVFSLTSVPPDEAWFRDSEGCTVGPNSQVVECDPAESVPLTIRVKNNDAVTQVTVSLAPLQGLDDPIVANNSAMTTLEAFRPAADASVDVAAAQEQGNSGMATLSVSVSNSDPTVPVTLVGLFNPAFLDIERMPIPETCETAQSGIACSAMNGDTFSFAVDVGRVQNNTRFEDFGFTVSVPETHADPDITNNTDVERVERFGKDLVDNGDSGGTPENQFTTEGLQPSDTSSPVVETIADAAETFTKVARTVTLTEQRSVKERTSSTTSRVTNPARTANTAERELSRKPSGSKATSRAAGTDRREAVRDDRESRAETSDKKPSAGAERSQKKSTDTTSPVADTISDDSTTSVVDTVVTVVENIL